jgi:hypothetical protein
MEGNHAQHHLYARKAGLLKDMAPIGSEPTTFETQAIVDVSGVPLNAASEEEQNPRLRKTGDHTIERFRKIAAEWIPEDKGAIKFRDAVIEELERIVNSEPDFDTGYFKVTNGLNRYTIAHRLGRIPTRHIIYVDTQGTDEPEIGKAGVAVLSSNFDNYWDGSTNVARGVFLQHGMEGQNSYILTASDYTWSDQTSAYIRVLLWR